MELDPREREVWKDIPYLEVDVSSFGNVRNIKTKRWLRPHMSGKGYLRCQIKRDGKPVPELIHRLVLLAFLGPCPSGHEVNHINNVTTDNRLVNLEYVTSSENTLHAVEMGTWPIGSKRWNSVLTEEIVREMRCLSAEGLSIKQIAEKFGTNFTTTYHVVKRHNWKHVA